MALTSLWDVLAEVGSFWRSKAYRWWNRKPSQKALFEALADAQTYEEWEDIALQLDDFFHTDLWRQSAPSKYYDYRLMNERRRAIIKAREEEDILGLVNLLRSGLVRNLGNITAPRLFNRAYAGTKLLIEDYITQVAFAIEYVTALPTAQNDGSGWTSQTKLDLLHDTRQAFGRSTLVLQGGAIFGLCHLGVVKALHLRGLLPRIITGTATGALIAALVGTHTEDELLDFLNGDGIDLTAFTKRPHNDGSSDGEPLVPRRRSANLQTLLRRLARFIRTGHFLDSSILEECVRANVGDLTFEEAYSRTKRVLNITVATSGRGGLPNLLNYLTAPNVLIWSAALASNASSSTMYSPVILRCKDETGAIVPWTSAQEVTFRPWRHTSYADRESPLSRIAELFNVNHFVVSQARPYLAPFLRAELQHPDPRQAGKQGLTIPLMRLVSWEIYHRLSQLDSLGLLPSSVRRLLIDETIPGANLTLVPDLSPGDFWKLLETPTKQSVEYWILHGERSVWPAVSALKVRCAIEVELDRSYQLVRRRKPFDTASPLNVRTPSTGDFGKRRRAASPDRNRHKGTSMSKTSKDSSLEAQNVVEDKKIPIHRLGLPAEILQKLPLLDRSTKSLSSNDSDLTHCNDILDLLREIDQHRLKWVELQWRIEARTYAMEMRALRDSSGDYDDWAKGLAENFGCVRAKVARATTRISELQEDVCKKVEELCTA